MNLFTTIKQRLTILEVVSEYATLKKAGLYWKGCCPFHHERTASFTVSPHKEIFYCFGCHAGGDVISFITKIEHCSPIEAAKHLVERYNIPVPEDITWDKSSDSQEARNSYQATCALFARWCQEQLTGNAQAQQYLTQRGITAKSIEDFSIGYCSGNIKSLLAFAQKENILAQNFIDAHIVLEGRTGLYTPFEDRIIFPITDTIGRIVGFGGRSYKTGDERVKYYNSHDHAFFNKGTILYGLNAAKKAIAEQEAACLVEGYTDLILMHQRGFTTAVATMGTACTPEQLKLLARYAQKLYIMYDADPAGQNAVMRLVELCWQAALDPYVVTLPTGQDPASYLLAGGLMQEKIASAQDIFTFVLTHQAEDFSHKSLQERLGVVKKIVALIHQIPDPLKRSLLIAQAAETFALPREALLSLAASRPSSSYGSSSSRSSVSATPAQEAQEGDTAAHELTNGEPNNPYLSISLLEKKIFSAILMARVTLSQEDESLLRLWFTKEITALYDTIKQHMKADGIDIRTLFETLTEEEKAFVSQCISTQELAPEGESGAYIQELIALFFKKQWKLTVHNVKLRISEAQKQGDAERVKELLTNLDLVKRKMQGGAS